MLCGFCSWKELLEVYTKKILEDLPYAEKAFLPTNPSAPSR
jgi:hypothetical protein